MPPLLYTLRHNAATLDWELLDSGETGPGSHHATHASAFARLAADPEVTARGATLQVFGADGGFVRERAYPICAALDVSSAASASRLAA